MTMLSEHYLDGVYAAAVESVEEAIVNVLVAAETMTLVKPEGHYEWHAIDHRAPAGRSCVSYHRLSDAMSEAAVSWTHWG